MKSGGPIGFEQRAGGWSVLGRLAVIAILNFDKLAKAFEEQLALEHSADVGYASGFSFLPQLAPDGGGERSQLLSGIHQDIDGDLVAVNRRLVDQLRKGS